MIGLYGAMALLGLLIAAGRGNPDLYRLGDPPGWLLLVGPGIGVLVGVGVVGLTRLASKHFAWARYLHARFREVLGPLTGREIVIVALASSIGEEVLFRGALLPWMGVWLQGLVFALLHVAPDRKMLPWTALAFALGGGFGVMAEETGSLGAPIAAHFMINFLNLRHIVSREA